jgi:hypothetical protein
MQSNFLGALGQFLYLLSTNDQFAFGLDYFEIAAQPGACLFEDAVTLWSKMVVDEIREDQYDNGQGNDSQGLLLLHVSAFRYCPNVARTQSAGAQSVRVVGYH